MKIVIEVDVNSREEIGGLIERVFEEKIVPDLYKQIYERVNTEEIGSILQDRIEQALRYASFDSSCQIHSLSRIFQDRVQEIASRITDEDLKKVLLNRFFEHLK